MYSKGTEMLRKFKYPCKIRRDTCTNIKGILHLPCSLKSLVQVNCKKTVYKLKENGYLLVSTPLVFFKWSVKVTCKKTVNELKENGHSLFIKTFTTSSSGQ